MLDTAYSALFIIVLVSVQFTEFDFSNIILSQLYSIACYYCIVVQSFSIIVLVLLSSFIYSFVKFCDTILSQSDR